MSQLSAAIERRPVATFGVFLVLHLLIWTALPAVLYRNLPLDLIEALTFGREWQLGYDKLPPLPWWLVDATYRLAGPDVAYYLLAQVAVVIAFWLIWLTARPLIGPIGALAAVLIIDGIHYYTYTAAKFNHDVIQLPFWALAGYAFRRALHERRLAHWITLGLAIGASLWAKYFVVMLAAPVALFVLLDREARKNLATAGPYVAAIVALLVTAPHLVWLVQNDFLPFAYAAARAAPSRGLIDHVLHPLQFAAGQVGFLLPALLIAAPLFWPREPSADRISTAGADAYDRRIVTLLAFGPVTAVLALSAITGRGTIALWGYPLWLFLGLWMVLHWPNGDLGRRVARIVVLWASVVVILILAFMANYVVLPHYDGRYRAVLFPGERLALEMSQRFRAAAGRPLDYVIAEMWVGGNIAHYAPERPRVLIDGNPRRAPWIDLADLKAKGALLLWVDRNLTELPEAFRAVAGNAHIQQPFSLPFRAGGLTLEVGWAVLPPEP
jgi:4-amino-4-deoxy-L-arabinose transferase-like glycosyltransferase